MITRDIQYMNKIQYKLTTKYGGWYEVDSRGYVIKCDNGLDKTNASLHDLMSWQVTGIRKIDNFGNIGVIVRLDEAVGFDKSDLLHKNGTPKYVICDIDHGTERVHGNHKVHGLVSVFLV